jgi:hypothetical protein
VVADPTERFEDIARRAEATAERIMGKVEAISPDRPIGSERQSNEELLRDYIPIQSDQVALDQRAKEFISQYGFREGLKTYQQWVIEMEKLIG